MSALSIMYKWVLQYTMYPLKTTYTCLQCNLSNPDTLGTEESVLISEVVLISGVKFYTNMAFGTAKSDLFIKVSISGCPD